jgi:dihydrofolate reductase
MVVSLIVAADENNLIGGKNQLLWHLPNDMKHFRELTEGHTVIMGRRTFESIGRVLPRRRNLIITREKNLKVPGAEIAASLDEALQKTSQESGEVFVIGGGQIYAQAIERADRIYLTRVHGEFVGDIFFPVIDQNIWEEISREEHVADEKHAYGYTFLTFNKKS